MAQPLSARLNADLAYSLKDEQVALDRVLRIARETPISPKAKSDHRTEVIEAINAYTYHRMETATIRYRITANRIQKFENDCKKRV